jgi:hypothetical protein
LAVLIGLALVLSGVALAVLGAERAPYSTTALSPSGSFFALASSDSTLYAASDSGGSILLEESRDQGVDWTANPVPYSAVAGGAPWAYSAVAVDGGHVLLAAATAGSGPVPAPYGGTNTTNYPPGPGVYALAGGAYSPSCGTNSTLLVATSADGGRNWNTTTLANAGVDVTSLVGSVVGVTAAVAWMGTVPTCGASTTVVGALTSHDAGAHWSGLTSLVSAQGALPAGNGVEMAPEYDGLLLAFAESFTNGSGTDLALWQLPANQTSGGFSPVVELPAPTSWSLQGSPTTPAYLLTPTYLIPLTRAPYTALPFDQLQQDAPAVGRLPAVVSLLSTGPTSLEIAATTADDLGVDCWQFDLITDSIAQSCHVPLVVPLFAPTAPLPIVALIDGGGWWVGIGASGANTWPACYGGCPPMGAPSNAGASPPASVGTSICLSGCSSANGLVAYSYAAGGETLPNDLNAAGLGLLFGGLLVWCVAVAWVLRARRREMAWNGSVPG